MQSTLVAFYGDKPLALASFLAAARDRVRELLGVRFSPYESAQIHATIVGLECQPDEDGKLVNENFLHFRGVRRATDVPKLVTYLRTTPVLPCQLRFGGFARDARYPFTSRGEHPFARSFSIQDVKVVIAGWPVDGDSFPTTLGRLRREAERFGVLHKYHADPHGLDNDAFLVLGHVTRTPGDDFSAEVVQMREWLAGHPVEVLVTREALDIVSYVDPTLPLSTSTRTNPI